MGAQCISKMSARYEILGCVEDHGNYLKRVNDDKERGGH